MAEWNEEKRYNHGRRAWSDGHHKKLIEPLLQEIFSGWRIQKADKEMDMERKIDYILKRGNETMLFASRVRHFYSTPSMFNVYESNDITIRETELKSQADYCLYCVLDEDEESIARWHIFGIKKLLGLINGGKIEHTEHANRGPAPFKFFTIPLGEMRKSGCLRVEEDIRQKKIDAKKAEVEKAGVVYKK